MDFAALHKKLKGCILPTYSSQDKFRFMKTRCPVCYSTRIESFKEVKDHIYFKYSDCEIIFLSTEILNKIDSGSGLSKYSGNYWNMELKSAKERSWGPALARVAELFLYSRMPVKKFIDIGSGPGYLLGALQYQLPSAADIFYAQELFPPDDVLYIKKPNYLKGSILDFSFSFDAGRCIEVIEHLTPTMVEGLFRDLAKKSKINSIYIFNTGLANYIEKEDIGYLDPYIRGHIMGWSIKAIKHLAGPIGFQVFPIPGKTWAFIIEYKPDHTLTNSLTERIWHGLPENISVLCDKKTGDLLYVLGLDTARAYSC